jgi:ABC-type transport system substrate-binding protein
MASENYWKRLNTARYSRRRALKIGTALSAGVAGFALVGCGGDDSEEEAPSGTQSTTSTPEPTSGTDGSGGEPKRGGQLRVHSIGNLPTFDLHQNISVVTTAPVSPMFNKLVKIHPHRDGEIVGDLATGLPEQPEDTRYVFTLNSNVKFHNGSTLTSEDVKANYEWMLSPPDGFVSTREAILGPMIDNIETPDDETVLFNLTNPAASFLVNQLWSTS